MLDSSITEIEYMGISNKDIGLNARFLNYRDIVWDLDWNSNKRYWVWIIDFSIRDIVNEMLGFAFLIGRIMVFFISSPRPKDLELYILSLDGDFETIKRMKNKLGTGFYIFNVCFVFSFVYTNWNYYS